MKAWIQRVTEASVTVGGDLVSSIGQGYLVLLGVTHSDTDKDAKWIADKIVGLRIFEDEKGLMNRSIVDVGGSVIVVSQFTLYGDAKKGRRPSFVQAARPEQAEPLYQKVVDHLRAELGEDRVGTGRFRTEMKVHLVNDGPVSIELRTDA